MVSGITKYSHELTCVEEVKSVVQTAMTALTTGRGGPVWLSIPLDIQGALIDGDIPCRPLAPCVSDLDLSDVYTLLTAASRPVIIAGNGIKLANCREAFRAFVDTHRIPVVTSYLGADVIETGYPYFVGRVGIYADRCGNFAVQNSDLLLVLGCRMSQAVVGYNPKTFARAAKVIYLDIDPNELAKTDYHCKVLADLGVFFSSFSAATPAYSTWVAKCQHWKAKWMFELPPDTDAINPYHAVKRLYERLPENKITTTGSGSIAIIVNQLVNIKKNDVFIWSGHGDMGTDLPMSIGSHIADTSKTYVLFTSEGTLQFNIQELQTIVHHKLPIKIIVFNNASYGAIEITQKTFFGNKFGVDQVSGLSFPDTGKIAAAYGIQYMSVREKTDLEDAINRFAETSGPVIFEIFVCIQSRVPKLSSRKNEDGSFTSLPFEDMEPFLSREEFNAEMIVQPI
jgi:acetolactate synthase-1/2/3 large subunit